MTFVYVNETNDLLIGPIPKLNIVKRNLSHPENPFENKFEKDNAIF